MGRGKAVMGRKGRGEWGKGKGERGIKLGRLCEREEVRGRTMKGQDNG